MKVNFPKLIYSLAAASFAVALSAPAQADNWHDDWWDNDEKHIFREYNIPETCVAVYDTVVDPAPKIGDFCYSVEGTQRVREQRNRSIIKLEGHGTARLWEDGVPHTGTTGLIGTTHFEWGGKIVMNKNDTIKTLKTTFDSKPFQITTNGECRRISVEQTFVGTNQIGGTAEAPEFDLIKQADDVVVTQCSRSRHGMFD